MDSFFDIDKLGSTSPEGSGTKEVPEWNLQAEFISAEENRKFRGACTAGTYLFLLCLSSSKS